MVEFAFAFPIVLALTLGGLDFAQALWQFNAAAKAAQVGARFAIVNKPVASDLMSSAFSGAINLGASCTSAAGVANAECNTATLSSSCSFNPKAGAGTPPAGAGSCSGSKTYSDGAFTAIFNRMQLIYPALTKANVKIEYTATGLGFAGQPGGPPVAVTVSLRCLTFDLPFASVLADLVAPTAWAGANAGCGAVVGNIDGWPMPDVRTTLTSENMKL